MADDDSILKNVGLAALSGVGSGALMGGAGRFIAGSRKLKEMLKAAAMGGALSGATAGLATGAGTAAMGVPDSDESNAYATRGLTGGALLGGTVGAGIGGALGLKGPGILAKLPKIVKQAGSNLPLDNMLTDKLLAYAAKPGASSAVKGALLGAGTLGAAASYLGGDEGMQIDLIRDQMNALKRKRAKQRANDAGLA